LSNRLPELINQQGITWSVA